MIGKNFLLIMLGSIGLLPQQNSDKGKDSIQTTGKIGSPSATTTITGDQLPPPDPKFGGVINMKATESTQWWAPRVVLYWFTGKWNFEFLI